MQSWSLKSFIEEYSIGAVTQVWRVSRQAVFNARTSGRDIRIVKVDGHYEVRESKILKKVPCDSVQFIKLVNQGE